MPVDRVSDDLADGLKGIPTRFDVRSKRLGLAEGRLILVSLSSRPVQLERVKTHAHFNEP